MNTDFLGSPVLAVYIGQAVLVLIVVLCAFWLNKQLKFFGSMLMRESMKNSEESKVAACEVAEKVVTAAAEVKGALAEAVLQAPNPVLPVGTVVNMEVKKMDVKELNAPKKEKE